MRAAEMLFGVAGAFVATLSPAGFLPIQNAVSPREIGTATAAANLFRALGGSVGVAVYGAIFAAGLRHWLPLDLHGRVPQGITATGIQATPGRIHALAPEVQHLIADAVGSSLRDVFLVAAPIALLGCRIVLLLRERPLRGRDEVQPQPLARSGATAPQKQIAA